ncbi:MAG: type III pantothenate kinase [Zetaproteobacteria bacterium]|nr:type III pantothenate kinase [Zetaproteobacteria bacterium]
MKTFLVIDVGNTQIVLGLFQSNLLQQHWRISSNQAMTADELAWKIEGLIRHTVVDLKKIHGVMIASVVPHLDELLHDACKRILTCDVAFVGSSQVKTGMAVDYKNPREVGADRIVNAIAAKTRFGAPAIVLDCGTATTFDLVSAQGHYAGGLIIPGMQIALEALYQRAAKLPEVSLSPPETLIGRDTISSMQSGIFWSSIDGLNGVIKRLQQLDEYKNAPIIVTGGLSHAILSELHNITAHIAHLTLEGLHTLAMRHFTNAE